MRFVEANIHLGSQTISIGSRPIAGLKNLLIQEGYDKALVVLDKRISHMCKDYVSAIDEVVSSFKTITLDVDNGCKSMEPISEIVDALVALKATRKSCVIAIGGGALGDTGGLASALYMRGIGYIQVSTTMMAMCDAIIGKVAVNFGQRKNILGLFMSPRATFCDINFLSSLAFARQIEGLVEIWKHCLIREDPPYLEYIKSSIENKLISNPEKLIEFSLRVKAACVKDDPEDRFGTHKLLSLGHTFSNYLEDSYTFSHGVGVFYGILMASCLANQLGLVSQDRLNSIWHLAFFFEKHFCQLPSLVSRLDVDELAAWIKFDKINEGQDYTFVLPTDNGVRVVKGIGEIELKNSMRWFLDHIEDFILHRTLSKIAQY